MFERRLRKVAMILAALLVLILGRLMQVQVFARHDYAAEADKAMTQVSYIETTRGSILDVRGRVLAEDVACIDAAVDYRAVTRDTAHPVVNEWVRRLALQRLRARPDGTYRAAPNAAARKQMLEAEQQRVRDDIAAMWPRLAQMAGLSIEEMDDIRASIDLKVKIRHRRNTYRKFEAAMDEASKRATPPWYQRWLITGEGDLPAEEEYAETISEQTSPHVVLRAIPPEVQNALGRSLEHYPGLVLQPSTHRHYPYGREAAHAIGYLRRVSAERMKADPDAKDETRAYLPNDLAGDSGIEALAEPLLRGSRGSESFLGGRSAGRVEPARGQDVTTTLDIELQAEIRDLFTRVKVKHPDSDITAYEVGPMHGAAVVIDVPSGEVRALVSYPDFDLNGLAEGGFSALNEDRLNRPLFNRATMAEYEPGSTVKPVAGIAGISAGVSAIDERFECTGYLVIGGRQYARGRCWTANIGPTVYAHHSTPWDDPHRGPSPEQDGHLDLAEAIQRSCNIYFQKVANRLGPELLSDWYERFGLGRPTGIGIAERPGRLPRGAKTPQATWSAGMGQGSILATPLQVANVMATIARDGEWARPRLVRAPLSTPAGAPPDRAPTGARADAIREAQRGMGLVVSRQGGTGHAVRRNDVAVAAKTGSAQAAEFKLAMVDEKGKEVLDARGRRHFVTQQPSIFGKPNPQLPWYRSGDLEGGTLTHAWFVGYAPAENPTVAFAVLVEYAGGGGNAVAGPLAAELLDACIKHGYVPTRR